MEPLFFCCHDGFSCCRQSQSALQRLHWLLQPRLVVPPPSVACVSDRSSASQPAFLPSPSPRLQELRLRSLLLHSVPPLSFSYSDVSVSDVPGASRLLHHAPPLSVLLFLLLHSSLQQYAHHFSIVIPSPSRSAEKICINASDSCPSTNS